MYTAKERKRYNEDRQITCNKLGITENQYNWLRRKGQTLQKIYTDSCNGGLNDAQYEALTKQEYAEIKAYLKKEGLKLYIYYQTDPRGASIYLDKKAIPENNYNQAECIY